MNWDKRKIYSVLGLLLILAFAGGMKYATLRGSKPVAEETLLQQGKGAGDGATLKEESSVIQVYVTGEVEKPGVYQIQNGARVYEAVNMAKTLDTADMNSINLARKLQDEEAIVVPAIGAMTPGTMPLQTATQLPASGGVAVPKKWKRYWTGEYQYRQCTGNG